jgi:hypothetical protein
VKNAETAISETVIEVDLKAEQTAGYCSICNEIVPRDSEAKCIAGHPADFVSGLIELEKDGSVPFQLPKFNWGAALMPPVWGPIHGALTGALFLPVVIFANRAMQMAVDLPDDATLAAQIIVWFAALGITAVTLLFAYYYGRRGWGIAWNKSAISHTPRVTKDMLDAFIKREHLWTALSVLLFAGFAYLAVTFWLMS